MSDRNSPLLSTKLNRPPVTSDQVYRARLIEQLDHSLQHGPFTLVCTSAGFGKTMLVSSWIESLAVREEPPTPAAWLSLDEGDSDLVLFLRYFVAGIRTVFPEACPQTLSLLLEPNPPDQRLLVVAFSNELEQLPARIVFVLDDYHTIQSHDVHNFLSEMMRHWPQHLHLVLISRRSPPLPIATLRGRGQVGEIRTHDLRFTPAEAERFLEMVLAVPLSRSAIAILDQRLEGWIAGLRLVALSLRTGANTENELEFLAGTPVEIADYLVDEVLSAQTPAILRFLLGTSILDRFCPALCECILNSANDSGDHAIDVPASIQWLESNNLFVVPLDNEGRWYRYHHLFQEFLQRRLPAEMGPAQVTELHRRAVDWFSGEGLIDEALNHALVIGDLDLAARLMAAGLCAVFNREDRPTLDRWLRPFPDEFVQRHPWLLMIKVVVLGLSWQVAAQWRLLGQVEALLDQGDGHAQDSGELYDLPVLRGMIASLRGQEAYCCGHADRAIAFCEEALALLPHRWTYVRGIAAMYLVLSMQATGRGETAQRMLIDEYEGLTEKTDAYALRLLFAACFNAIEAGDLEQAKLLAQTMLDHATAGKLPHALGFSHYFLGVVHYCWNELDAAKQHFEELVDKRFTVHTQAARNGMVGLVRVHVAKAEIAEAWSIVETLSQFDLDRLGQDGDDARSLRAQLELVQGDRLSALRWADSYTVPVQGRSLLWLQDPHLAKACILLARGTSADLQAALDILDVLGDFAQRTHNVRVQIQVLAARAVTLEMQGKAAAAGAALQQAVELAQHGPFIRIFVDLGAPMRTLLHRLSGQNGAVDTVYRILLAFSGPQGQTTPADAGPWNRAANAGLVEPLTDRELDVLALLRKRMSNKEIAHELVLSPDTVKRYAVNIYAKLDVSKRWEAVVKAETLGILPPQ